jgi:8-oxo-dGTP diphosphatase
LLHQSVRGPDDDGDWAWSAPGGSLEPGETGEECAARELLEETGLDVPLVRVPESGLPISVFTCEARASHDVVLSEEHDRFEWVSFDDARVRCRPDKVVVALDAARRYLP